MAKFGHICHIDDAPCEVVELFAPSIRALLTSNARAALPCYRCRELEKRVRDLAGVRLGKHERALLLCANSPEGAFIPVSVHTEPRTVREAKRRAAQRLSKLGLLEREGRWRSREQDYSRIVVRLTMFGHVLRSEVRRELQEGKRIRWSDHSAAIVGALRREPPDLLSEYEETLSALADRTSVELEKTRKSLDESKQRVAVLRDRRDQLRMIRTAIGARRLD